MTHDYKRNGTATLFAALDVLDGQVISMCDDRHRHQERLKFLRVIDHVTPAEKQIHMHRTDSYTRAELQCGEDHDRDSSWKNHSWNLCRGTRTTQDRPPDNRYGPDVVDLEETWVSPDLKIVVISKDTSSDPSSDQITTEIRQLDRSEPNAALFEIPGDYKTVEATTGPR